MILVILLQNIENDDNDINDGIKIVIIISSDSSNIFCNNRSSYGRSCSNDSDDGKKR